jgi:hypothetical protein
MQAQRNQVAQLLSELRATFDPETVQGVEQLDHHETAEQLGYRGMWLRQVVDVILVEHEKREAPFTDRDVHHLVAVLRSYRGVV